MHIVIFGVINSEDAIQKYGFHRGATGRQLPHPVLGITYHQPYLRGVFVRFGQLCTEYHLISDATNQLRF